jgi:hypothetical protein
LTEERSPTAAETFPILLNDPYFTAIENFELRPDIEVPDLIQIGRGFNWKMSKKDLHELCLSPLFDSGRSPVRLLSSHHGDLHGM